MQRNRVVGALVTALVVYSWSVETAQATDFLDDKALLSTIPGHTLSGVSNEDFETIWVQSYNKGQNGGTASGRFGTKPYKSKWRVGRGLWCETWTQANGAQDSGCWRIERIDEDTLQPWSGNHKLPNVWRILGAN